MDSMQIEAERLVREAVARVERCEAEVALEFAGIRRIDAATLRAMEQLGAKARERSARVVVGGVTAEVYKALKVAGVTGVVFE